MHSARLSSGVLTSGPRGKIRQLTLTVGQIYSGDVAGRMHLSPPLPFLFGI